MKFWSKTQSISGVTRLGSKIMFYNMKEKCVKEQQNSLQTVYFLGKMSYLCTKYCRVNRRVAPGRFLKNLTLTTRTLKIIWSLRKICFNQSLQKSLQKSASYI